jgi:hypothetical protein
MSNSALRHRAAARSTPSLAIARLISPAMLVAADPAPRNRGAEKQKALIGKLLLGDAQRCVDAGERDTRRALVEPGSCSNSVSIAWRRALPRPSEEVTATPFAPKVCA